MTTEDIQQNPTIVTESEQQLGVEEASANPETNATQETSNLEAQQMPEMALTKLDFEQPAEPLDLNPTKLPSSNFRIEPVKFSDLLANNSSAVNLSKGLDVKIGNPIYITNVRVTFFSGNSNRVEFIYKSPIHARKLEVSSSSHGNEANFEINGFATSFSLSPKSSGWFGSSETVFVKSIEVFGFEPDKFIQIEKSVQEHLKGISFRQEKVASEEAALHEAQTLLKKNQEILAEKETSFENSLASREQKIQEAEAAAQVALQQKNESISELSREIERLTTEKNSLDKASADLKAEVTTLESKTNDLQQKATSLETTCVDRQNEIDNKSAILLQMGDKLKKLENDLSVTVDLKGYGKKTLFNIALYTAGIFVLVDLGRQLTNYALAESKDIWTAYIANPQLLDMKVLVGIKLPFIILVSTALTTLFKLALALLRRIMQNEDRRTSLAEISILAGDLTDAAMYGSTVTEHERNQLKFAAKMWLVRDLLSNRIVNNDDTLKEAEETPSSITGWVKTLPQLGEKKDK